MTILSALASPVFWSGAAAGALLMLLAGLALVALVSRANDDPDPHAVNLGTGAAWPGSIGSEQIHPRSRRSELRSRPS